MHAILLTGKELRGLLSDDDRIESNIVRSGLLRRLILTASSTSVISHAVKLLSCLNKDAADQGDMQHLFNLSHNEFPDVRSLKNIIFSIIMMFVISSFLLKPGFSKSNSL